MKKVWILLTAIVMLVACTKEVPTKETAVVIGDATVANEKIVFPIFLEQSKLMAQMPVSASKELIRKGDRIKVEVADIKSAQKTNLAPIANFKEKIKSK